MTDTFNKELKIDDFIYATGNIEYYSRNPQGLKNQLLRHYKSYSRSATNGYKIANELYAIFTAKEDEPLKQRILDELEFSCCKLNSLYLPLPVYQFLLWLTFPIIAELTQKAYSFGENCFSPEAIAENISIDFDSEKTKKTIVYRAIKTMEEVGIVRKLKRGLYKNNDINLIDAQGIAIALIGATALGDEMPDSDTSFLSHLTFEISHDFIECYSDIDYSKVVPVTILEAFKTSRQSHILQYNHGTWSISDQPLVPRDVILKSQSFDVSEIINAKK